MYFILPFAIFFGRLKLLAFHLLNFFGLKIVQCSNLYHIPFENDGGDM